MVETLKAASSEDSDCDIDVIVKGVLRSFLTACPGFCCVSVSLGHVAGIHSQANDLVYVDCSFA